MSERTIEETIAWIEKLNNLGASTPHSSVSILIARIRQQDAALKWYVSTSCEYGEALGACGKLPDDECSGCRAYSVLMGGAA